MPVLPRGAQSVVGRSTNVSTTGVLPSVERMRSNGPTRSAGRSRSSPTTFQGLLTLDEDHLDGEGAYVPQWSTLRGATTDGYFITPVTDGIYTLHAAFTLSGVSDDTELGFLPVAMIGGDETDLNGGHGNLMVQGGGEFTVGVPWITLLGPGIQAAGITGPFFPVEGLTWRIQITGFCLAQT